jgi:hypothetical protein
VDVLCPAACRCFSQARFSAYVGFTAARGHRGHVSWFANHAREPTRRSRSLVGMSASWRCFMSAAPSRSRCTSAARYSCSIGCIRLGHASFPEGKTRLPIDPLGRADRSNLQPRGAPQARSCTECCTQRSFREVRSTRHPRGNRKAVKAPASGGDSLRFARRRTDRCC